ncbi:MAG TPA: hypothetical protein VN703_00755, partial [Candidatus Sulfopaludibacter sp.]|nr:hypothetical protein [Candidatus Sulfopaludibacter sp.]
GEWIIEKVYENDLINLAVDSLNLSSIYKNETIKIGTNDAARIERLTEIGNKINDTKRYFETDYQLVEDAIEAAVLARMLEKPKDEVIGKFDRALRFGQKLKNEQQLGRIYYQRAWTYIHWYDDYKNFITEFNYFKSHTVDYPNISNLELYTNLLNILRGIFFQKTEVDIDLKEEEKIYYDLLDECIKDISKPTTALVGRTLKAAFDIIYSLENEEELSKHLKEFNACLQESIIFLEYPFETFKMVIEIFGELLPNNKDYDIIIDTIAEISEGRASELAAGQIYFKRGFQKLLKHYNKESLIYFGKSIKKLAKEESQDDLYFALIGLSQAYRNMGLLWAANNCLLAASSMAIKEWYNEGKLTKRLYRCVEEALKNELFLGRLPNLLNWHQIFKVIQMQFDVEQIEDGDLATMELVDACLSVRLLNSKYNIWKTFSYLPDILERERLWLSQDAVLYLLGYVELINHNHFGEPKTIEDHFNIIANQPFRNQIVHETNLLDTERIEYRSTILGTEFCVKFENNKDLVITAEIILAYLESFLAPAFMEIYPTAEVLTFNVTLENIGSPTITENDSKQFYEIKINSDLFAEKNYNQLQHLLQELSAKILSANFIFKDPKQYFEKIFKQDEVHERVSIVINHATFLKNIFGENPKLFLKDWKNESSAKDYTFKRLTNPLLINKPSENNLAIDVKEEVKEIKHNQTKVSSIIDAHLWNQAS